MNKEHFTTESNKTCIVCGKPLKLNLVKKQPNAPYDYVCYNIKVLGRNSRFREKCKKDKNGNSKSPIDLVKKMNSNIKKYKN
jgi:hypothetical protein